MNISETLTNPILSGGLMLSIMGAAVYSLKNIAVFTWRRIVRRYIHTIIIYDYDELYDVLERWLYANYPTSYKEMRAKLYTTSGNTRKGRIVLQQEPSVFWIKVKGKWLLFEARKIELKNAASSLSLYAGEYAIKGFNARNHIIDFLHSIANEHLQRLESNQISVFRNDSSGDWIRASPIKVKPLDKIILDPTLKSLITEDVKEFAALKEWYHARCIPYKRQYVLYGPPGTGKTSIALAVAAMLNTNIYALNIKELKGESSLQRAFCDIPKGGILLIEDIDAIFNQRHSASEVSFSALLNCMDGAFYNEGLITFITTNHISALDPALLRTGRTDLCVEVFRPYDSEISAFLSMFYQKPIPFAEGNMQALSMSDIQEACITNRNDAALACRDLRNKIQHLTLKIA